MTPVKLPAEIFSFKVHIKSFSQGAHGLDRRLSSTRGRSQGRPAGLPTDLRTNRRHLHTEWPMKCCFWESRQDSERYLTEWGYAGWGWIPTLSRVYWIRRNIALNSWQINSSRSQVWEETKDIPRVQFPRDSRKPSGLLHSECTFETRKKRKDMYLIVP